MSKKRYKPGQYLGPNKIYFKEEIEPKIYPSGRKIRRGVFICPICSKEFSTEVQSIYTGHTRTCGCSRYKDITNQKFNKLTALYKVPNKTDCNNNYYWHCKCDCGNEVDVATTYLISGKTKSCGCSRHEDLEGRRFGHLTVLNYSHGRHNIGGYWKCQCDCGNIIEVSTSHLNSGHTQSCGCLKESKGERKIQQWLINNNINFQKEYKFSNCYYKDQRHLLRLDFYLPDYNICIEYDGEQHFKPIEYFGGKEKFKHRQQLDNIKNQYCKDNGIKMIRIPYWAFSNIDDILFKEIF